MAEAKNKYIKDKLSKKLRTTKSPKLRKSIKTKLKNLNQKKENTKPELITKKVLEQLNQLYIQQYPLSGFFYDFYLPDHNILIEVNGDFFHSNPVKYPTRKFITQKKNYKRDRIKLAVAIKKGFRIFYIWENDLKPGKLKLVREHLAEEIDRGTKKAVHMLEHIIPQYETFYRVLKENN